MGAVFTYRQLGWALLAPAFLYSASAQAAGFYIQESSVSALGSAFSGSVSSTDDASTIFFNPAGMTDLSGRQAQLGVNLLLPTSKVTNKGSTFDFNGPAPGGVGPIAGGNGGNPYDPTPVPNAFFATPLQDGKLWAGIGVSAPFGLANEYDSGWFGRYDSTKTELTVLNFAPSLAYKINDYVSIGGGVDVQYARAKLEAAVSNVVSEGTSQLKGDSVDVGYNVGLIIKPVEGTRIGAHYRSAISHELDGHISVSGLNAGNFSLPGHADLDLPDIASLGITQDIRPDWRVMGQLTWFGWSNFESIEAFSNTGLPLQNVPQGYENTLAFSVGTEYDATPEWTLRAGYQYDPTPTTDQFRTSRTPDGDRNWFTAGASYKWSEATSLDLGAAYIDVGDETINLSRNSGLANIVADTKGSVGIISAAVNYKF